MWKNVAASPYYLLFTKTEIGYKLHVTDFISLWTINFTETSFLGKLKDSNEDLELESDNEFIQKGAFLFSHLEELTRKNINVEDSGNLFLDFKIWCGCPFCFQCSLKKAPEQVFFKFITQNLLKIISDLKSSQSELRALLMKKDKEIEEYKSEGGEIVLRHLKTGSYNDERHMKSHKVYEEYFGEASVPSEVLEKSIKVPIESDGETIASPYNNIKTERNELTSSNTLITVMKKEPITSTSSEIGPYVSTITCKQESVKTEPAYKPDTRRKRLRKLNY